MKPRFYVTTTIPYVNARPHLGHALEFVQADVLARHRRLRGEEVRFLSGTDDNALKNVQAAEAAGVDVRRFVDANGERFAALRDPLELSYDDFIRTSSDPRHRPGVERLWQGCAESGDLYRRFYQGRYCVGCEQFYDPDELAGGRCPEHGTVPEPVEEENWFFRLSRYADRLRELVASGELRIEPEARRREVLAFIEGGLHDLSVSRTQERARGWGIPVPGDPTQVVYVWWDALGNYVTALGYGADHAGEAYRRWWVEGGERVHVVGKGVLRFHAVYWPALLLSARLTLPTAIFVHDYLTVAGEKISKSSGNPVDPVELVARYGAEPLRWWLLREVPRLGDCDFTEARLVARWNDDLAHGVGNLVNRTLSLVHHARGGRPVPSPLGGGLGEGRRLESLLAELPGEIDQSLHRFDFRRALQGLDVVVTEANRVVEATRPWELARRRRGAGEGGERLDAVLGLLLDTCTVLADELRPFLPEAASRIAAQLRAEGGVLPRPVPLFPRLEPGAAA